MSDGYIDLITPVFYEPCGFDYLTNNVNARRIINKYIYIISSFDSSGNIISEIITGLTNNEGRIQQNGSLILLSQGGYYFFVSSSIVTNPQLMIKQNMCSDVIQILNEGNPSVLLPYFPRIQIKINGTSVRGAFSDLFRNVLKRFENPPISQDGTVGLHLPGDNTITYGYGEIVVRGSEIITDDLRREYPNMTLSQAEHRLRTIVLTSRLGYLNNRISYRNMQLTDNQFDALLSVEYNSGDSGGLLSTLKNIENTNSSNKQTEIFNAFISYRSRGYRGLIKRRKAEAGIYLHGYYDENFSY
jgi:GH24 family phage-related lysozyme (muramidase)